LEHFHTLTVAIVGALLLSLRLLDQVVIGVDLLTVKVAQVFHCLHHITLLLLTVVFLALVCILILLGLVRGGGGFALRLLLLLLGQLVHLKSLSDLLKLVIDWIVDETIADFFSVRFAYERD